MPARGHPERIRTRLAMIPYLSPCCVQNAPERTYMAHTDRTVLPDLTACWASLGLFPPVTFLPQGPTVGPLSGWLRTGPAPGA